MTDKSKLVKELFEDTELYLTYDYNLQIRKETVLSFTSNLHFKSVLDIPCGNGSISIPLLNQLHKLTLIDISSNMVALAKKNVDETNLNKVEFINKDFFEIDIPEKSYDLVICLGLLAHVNSPEQLLNKLSKIVSPNGYLIIQNTDSSHFYSHLIHLYLGLKRIISKSTYKLNKVKASYLENQLLTLGFKKEKQFRYNQSFLGLSNLFSNNKKYTLTRNFFGNAEQNKHANWGSDITYLFKKKSL